MKYIELADAEHRRLIQILQREESRLDRLLPNQLSFKLRRITIDSQNLVTGILSALASAKHQHETPTR